MTPRTRTRTRTIVLAAATAALVLGSTLPAAAATPDPFMGDPFGQNQRLEYHWLSGSIPPGAIKAAINAAADDANDSRRAKAPSFVYVMGSDNDMGYGVDAPCGVNGLACFRRDAPRWFGVYLRENGHRFDWGTLKWCEMTDRVNGCYDAENIVLDELGHVTGLDHHQNLPDDSDYGDAVVQTYSRTKPRDFYNAHVFGRCDVATLQQAYDVASPLTLYSTCLDVPTELSLSASRTSVVAAQVVTFTAVLESAGSGKLSNNFLSGRTVVLQQRSASGWSDVATMAQTATAGTYSTGLVLWSDADLRAVFRKPSTEGVRSSSSSVVAVTVTTPCRETVCPSQAGPDPVTAAR
jgi:hypothetical protein